MTEKPKAQNSQSAKELERLEKQFDEQKEQIDSLTFDRLNKAPKLEVEPQTKLSQNEISNSKDVYLKPKRTIGSKEAFNEKYREDYNFKKEYVYFIAENREVIGETIEFWTKPFAGMPAEEWAVPVNKPVWGPRYVAEQIKGCSYHRLSMDESQTTSNAHEGAYYGKVVVDNIVQRLDAMPASKKKSIFMGAEFN